MKQIPVGHSRLLRLAELLDNNARARERGEPAVTFSLDDWLGQTAKEDIAKASFRPKIDCGTTACAVGLACLTEEFRVEGLGYKFNGREDIYPTYDQRCGQYAVMQFFGVSDEEHNHLFMPDPRNRDERAVAEDIRELVGIHARTPA